MVSFIYLFVMVINQAVAKVNGAKPNAKRNLVEKSSAPCVEATSSARYIVNAEIRETNIPTLNTASCFLAKLSPKGLKKEKTLCSLSGFSDSGFDILRLFPIMRLDPYFS